MTKQETIELLGKQLPGFYSVEQVIKIINDIEDGSFEISDDMISTISNEIVEVLSSEGTDIVDDYELSMSYREVELDSINLNEDKIKAVVQDTLETYIKNNK
jgi:hypothetical protein